MPNFESGISRSPAIEASAGTGSVHAHHRRDGDCARDEGEMLPRGFKL